MSNDKIYQDIKEESDEVASKPKKFFFEWIVPIVSALIIAMIINKFLLFKVYIPSESMVPTLKIGDQLFVTKIYDTDKIKRGDIIVFYSDELNDLLIKRVIGLPGEIVDIKDGGKVYINGDLLDEPYVKNTDPKGGTFKVPEGKYLFLGDNRSNSKDSRWWKNPYIDKSDIKGKAQIRVYPFDRIGTLKE